MKVWMLFGVLTYFLMIVIFGYSLSSNIESNIEYMIFWMLYLATILTLTILMASFSMSFTLKDLKGMPGEIGESGKEGLRGDTGICDINCRDVIGYNIIMDAIKKRLLEKEAIKKGRNFSDLQLKINDHIRYYNNINKSLDEILQKLKEKYREELKEGDKDNKEAMLYIKNEYISKVLDNDYLGVEIDNFEINNSYIKEKVKTILDSNEFRDMAPYRGPHKLIEYIKDLWIIWTELIYETSNINYFTSVGAENDFEWTKDNPFNEIKKYDVFNWGLSDRTRPRVINVKRNTEKKVETGKEPFNELKNTKKSVKRNTLKRIKSTDSVNPEEIKLSGRERMKQRNAKRNAKFKAKIKNSKESFEDYTKLKKPSVKGRAKPHNAARLKIIRSNDYYFTYDDKDTTMMEQIRTYRPYSKIHNNDRYYPLGDVVVGPVKDNSDDGEELIFSDKYDNKDRTVKKNGKTEGPNRDTILVAGDVKKPIKYETIWYDLQQKMARHWTCRMCKKQPRSSYYKGIAHTPICPKGYTSIGDIYTSQDNQTPELKKRTNQYGTYEPIDENQPVCIPSDCVEVIRNTKPKIIWDTYRSNRPIHGSGSTNWYKYVVDNAQIFSFSPDTGKKEFVKATHENSYNLSKLWLEKKRLRKTTDSKRAERDEHLKSEYLESRESFDPVTIMAITALIGAIKGLKKPHMLRPYMYKIKEECIINDDGKINLYGDDYKWPSILKEDKTGEYIEDNSILFIPENENDEIFELIPENINSDFRDVIKETIELKKFFSNIKDLNKHFENNKYYEKKYIDAIDELNNTIIKKIDPLKYEYDDEDYSLFYFITTYIDFLSSIPALPRYKNIKIQKETIYNNYKEIIDPINEEKINNLKLKLGLGWKGIPRFDSNGEEYSMHHFFYLDNEGYCSIDNQILEFEKIILPDIYSLKIKSDVIHNNYLKIINKNNINTIIETDKNKLITDVNYHFKLKFTGNAHNQIIIKPAKKQLKKYKLSYYDNKYEISVNSKPSEKYIFDIKYFK